MSKCRSTRVIVGVAMVLVALCATRAAADPIAVSGFLSGDRRFAQINQELQLAFPDFTVGIVVVSPLVPGFCLSCGNGSPVPFTQTTGAFSGHSTALPGTGRIDADVSGVLSFVGPTDFISIDPVLGSDLLSSPVQVTGSLRITQANQVLFDGTLVGTGLASVLYENGFSIAGPSLGGYQFAFEGVAATPEPASLVLVVSGAAWLARKRRAMPGRPRTP
jgi:hypothetical protein